MKIKGSSSHKRNSKGNANAHADSTSPESVKKAKKWEPDEEPTTAEFLPLAMMVPEEYLRGSSNQDTAVVSADDLSGTNPVDEEQTQNSSVSEVSSDTRVTKTDQNLIQLTKREVEEGDLKENRAEQSVTIRARKSKKIDDYLEEIDFYISENLLRDAKELIISALEVAPEHPQLKTRLSVVEDSLQTAALGLEDGQDSIEEDAHDEGQTSKLGRAELSLLRSLGYVDHTILDRENQALPRANEESDLHCDRGLNYWHSKELDDAITEFNLAMDAEKNRAFCHMMIGICYREKQHTSNAINHFKYGLHEEKITPDEAVALYYELGVTYEQLGDRTEALYYFAKVQRYKPDFRDTKLRMAALTRSPKNVETVNLKAPPQPTAPKAKPTSGTPPPFRQNRGNHLTEVVDVDSIEVLGETAALPSTPPPFRYQNVELPTEILDVSHIEVLGEAPPAASTPPPFRYEDAEPSTEILDVSHIEVLSERPPPASTPPPFRYQNVEALTEVIDDEQVEFMDETDPSSRLVSARPVRYETEGTATEVLDIDKIDIEILRDEASAPEKAGAQAAGSEDPSDLETEVSSQPPGQTEDMRSMGQHSSWSETDGQRENLSAIVNLTEESPRQTPDDPDSEDLAGDGDTIVQEVFERERKTSSNLLYQTNFDILKRLHRYKKD